jgi:DNA-binding response OmpR family regulator
MDAEGMENGMTINVLIVDDNEQTLTLVSKILELDGYKVEIASNATDAFRLVKTRMPDLAILDVMMPDMNGYDLCKSLRQEPYNASMPVLILTADGNDLDKEHALACGANDLLTKPFNLDELRKHIKDLVFR